MFVWNGGKRLLSAATFVKTVIAGGASPAGAEVAADQIVRMIYDILNVMIARELCWAQFLWIVLIPYNFMDKSKHVETF